MTDTPELRDAVARLIDPIGWAFRDGLHDAIDRLDPFSGEDKIKLKARSDMYVKKTRDQADAVLALLAARSSEGGE